MSRFNAKASRAKRPCPIWVDAFQRDTQHLEADEIGAYFLILMAMWTRERCDFPNDEARLARVSRISLRLWKARVGPALREFFITENGALYSKALRAEADKKSAAQERAIPTGLAQYVRERDGGVCAYCSTTLGPFHLDHIIPWSRGGVHSPANLTVACASCNTSKGNRLLEEWVRQ